MGQVMGTEPSQEKELYGEERNDGLFLREGKKPTEKLLTLEFKGLWWVGGMSKGHHTIF